MSQSNDPWGQGTLFDPDFLYRNAYYAEKRFPYSLALQGFSDSESPSVPEDEVSVFSHVLEHEIYAYEPRGRIQGPLTFEDNRQDEKLLSCQDRPVEIPCFVEPDVLPIIECNARAVLLIEHDGVFRLLADSGAMQELNLLLITGCGVPRLGTRRFLRRLERECGLPVLLLTDHDTWGYWIYSVLKRGLMAPAMESDFASIRNLSFLGVRSGDRSCFAVPSDRLRPWEHPWDLRLRELRKQSCFQSRQWQIEFDRFEADRWGLDLHVLVEHLGVDAFVSEVLSPRIQEVLSRC